MTGCTQRGCVGTIVDGYCDVCGSPAGAPPFVPAVAVASAASPSRAARTGLTAGGRESGFRPGPRNCTQGGCVGTIVDGYCDVCGSPAGAPPFVSAVAVASAASPARAARTGPTAAGRGSGFRPGPRNCTQRGCVGTIVDGYCDVCGSPTGAPPFVPAAAAAQQSNLPEEETPTQLIPRVQTTAQPSTEETADVAAAGSEEETPTQLIPRVQTTAQPSTEETADVAAAGSEEETPTQLIPRVQATAQPSTEEAADQAAADPRAAGAENVDEEKVDLAASSQELSSQTLPHSFFDMELMIASIRSAAGEVDGERVGAVAAGSEETGTSPTGPDDPDTVQMAPVGAAAVDSEMPDLERPDAVAAGSEETGTSQTGPGDSDTVQMAPVGAVAVDSEVVDGDGVGPVAAGSEETGTSQTGPGDSDTVQMAPVGAVPTGGRHPPPQLPEQQVLEPVPVQNPGAKKRRKSLALAATALAALLIGAWFFGASRDGGSVPAQPAPAATATATATVSKSTSEPSDKSTDSGREESTIQLGDLPDSAMPFQTVRIQGAYGGRADIFLRVQRWEAGKWVDFPLPTKTDQSGRFTAYVEFGQPGRYTLRVQDPASGLTSETFVLVIKG
jgi:hypothetical protein